MDIRSEAEQFHAIWLENFKSFALDSLFEKYGDEDDIACILGYSDPDSFSMEVMGEIRLPRGSAEIMEEMAKFTKFELPISVIQNELEVIGIPILAFSLSDILMSAYPKNGKGNMGIFKSTTAGSMVGGIEESVRESSKSMQHAVFAGVGVILMEECREIVNDFSTIDDIFSETEAMYLCFKNKENEYLTLMEGGI